MSFLLKIIQGPNAGAEIALTVGTTVSFGRGDNCDIVLTDAALGEKAFDLEVTNERVMMLFPDGNQARLEPFHVRTVGTTALVIGPAEGAWKPLVREEEATVKSSSRASVAEDSETRDETAQKQKTEKPKKGRSKIGCFFAFLLLVLIIACAVFWWLKPEKVSGWTNGRSERVIAVCHPYWVIARDTVVEWCKSEETKAAEARAREPVETLDDVVKAYGLKADEKPSGGVKVTGDFPTRVERLQATARIYRVSPGAELDFSDHESLVVAIENVLALVTENRVKLASVSNRMAKLTGVVASTHELRKVLEAISRDVPKLERADCSGVRAGGIVSPVEEDKVPRSARVAVKEKTDPTLPIVGILVAPYPCLVLQNGARVMEGARFGEWTVRRITADSVELGGASGSFTWRP